MQWHNQATPEEQARVTGQGGGWAGVEGSKETLRWFWSKKFAAVGGDAIVFEVWPPLDAEYRELTSVFLLTRTMLLGLLTLQHSETQHLLTRDLKDYMTIFWRYGECPSASFSISRHWRLSAGARENGASFSRAHR